MFSHWSKPVRQFFNTLLLASLLLCACGSAARAPSMEYAAGAPAEVQIVEVEKQVAYESGARSAVPSQEVKRIVIKNANLAIVVADPSKSLDTISKMAEEMGGFVVTANLYHETLESGAQAPRASITIRVPAERLNEALDLIKAESDQEPLSESLDSQDVTSEYTDLQSRLRNLQNTEIQLTKIMEEAVKTEDVLSVYNRLVEIREQIEVIQGQIKYYEQSAALSAISVELRVNEAVQPLTIGGWQPVGVAKEAVQALINTLEFLANLLIRLIIFVVPVLLVLYLVFFLPLRFIWRKIRPKREKQKQPAGSPAKPEE